MTLSRQSLLHDLLGFLSAPLFVYQDLQVELRVGSVATRLDVFVGLTMPMLAKTIARILVALVSVFVYFLLTHL